MILNYQKLIFKIMKMMHKLPKQSAPDGFGRSELLELVIAPGEGVVGRAFEERSAV